MDLSRWLTEQKITQEQCADFSSKTIADSARAIGWSGSCRSILVTLPRGQYKAAKAVKYGFRQGSLMLYSDRMETNVAATPRLAVKSETVVTCAHATHGPDGCATNCIMYTGRGKRYKNGKESPIHVGRRRRTEWLVRDPQAFMAQLVRELDWLERGAIREGLTPVMRLNCISDLRWEKIVPWLFEVFPQTTFMDYTKWPMKARSYNRNGGPLNYILARSVQGNRESLPEVFDLIDQGHNVSMITDDPGLLLEELDSDLFVNADNTDTWMLDATTPTIGLLRPKAPMPKTHPQVFPAREVYKYVKGMTE